ncbi:DUF1963 domain-containing protein [Paenibacillus sp. MMS18-CY102]|uniref:DUF1963 domain-containing protein n=1 Tax=Paenibacillus sp. MMS18-CY102 TaxID=2682849 RepID=UPI0013656538|nr:DUF1963 domain-containing protein [Paenibacillus sp. MMS18-CY102]MWC29463.1 DUF1963 domain-containing protein [Paenibacillus sp. MMS18-CY102]
MNYGQIHSIISRLGLSEYSHEIMQAIKPSVRMALHPAQEQELALGCTKFGGNPDLPASFQWPVDGDEAFSFLFQLNLLELAAYNIDSPLPQEGILSFFINPATLLSEEQHLHSHARAFHFTGTDSLVRREPPLAAKAGYPTSSTTYLTELTLPPAESSFAVRLGFDYAQPTELVNYQGLLTQLNASCDPSEQPYHRIGGYPDQLQGDLERRASAMSAMFGV